MEIAKAKRWWRHGDDKRVIEEYIGGLKTTCDKCDELLRVHGNLDGKRVCPGNWIVEYKDGSLKIMEHNEYNK